MLINRMIEDIGETNGGLIKSSFTLAYWIHQANYFIHQAKKYDDQDNLRKLYIEKNNCAAMMLEVSNDKKVYKPNQDTRKWLICLENETEGLKYNIVIPYLLVKNSVDVNSLEETQNNKDRIFINGIEFKTTVYANKGNKLNYCIENMNKSRLKMIEKINSK